MPIEIRELHIRAVINQGGQQGNAPAPPGGNGGNAEAPSNDGSGGDTPDKDDIIAECVEKVLEILREKNER